MQQLAKGANIPLDWPQVKVHSRVTYHLDVVALLLDARGRALGDQDLVFWNNSQRPGVRWRPGSPPDVIVDTRRLPGDVASVVVAIALSEQSRGSFGGYPAPTLVVARPQIGEHVLEFTVDDLSSERALVGLEIYRRGTGWRIRAVGQGYPGGLASLLAAYGIEVDEPEPEPGPGPGAEPRPASGTTSAPGPSVTASGSAASLHPVTGAPAVFPVSPFASPSPSPWHAPAPGGPGAFRAPAPPRPSPPPAHRPVPAAPGNLPRSPSAGSTPRADAPPPVLRLEAGADPQSFMAWVLHCWTSGLPREWVRGDRSRGLSELLGGRPGTLQTVALHAHDQRLSLTYEHGLVTHLVGPVGADERRVSSVEWLEALTVLLHEVADQGGAVGTGARLVADLMGLRAPSPDVTIEATNVAAGLTSLPFRLRGLLPEDVVAQVSAIGELLRDTLPRVEPDTESARLVRRAAVDYLPSTLKAYLDLPADWARTHRVEGTKTSLDLLREQLELLRAGVGELFHAVCAQNARQLQANGLFLRDRFSPTSSSLNLSRAEQPPA